MGNFYWALCLSAIETTSVLILRYASLMKRLALTCPFYNTNTIFIIFFPPTYPYLLHPTHITTQLTIINKGVFVNETHFAIKINTANHFT